MSTKTELKIIADHLRSSCFLIADGILPSNEGRGYVLRRIMRRAMRQIHKLGAKEAVMHKLVDSLIKEMGDAYPELERARDTIIDALKNEEEKFRETLDKGLKMLDEEIANTKGNIFSGQTAFKLYDTYGFPLDLTQDILKEKSIQVDEQAFNAQMEEQRNRARQNWTGSGEKAAESILIEDLSPFDFRDKYGETEFLGYASTKCDAKIVGFCTSSDNPFFGIVLNQTSFYATSGGQNGDDGVIQNQSQLGEIEVVETKKFAGNLIIHFTKTEHKGTFNIGDTVTAIVNPKTRQAKAANHSATHLMHKALKQILGNSISQKGSNVDADYFTFDFNFNRAMSPQEIQQVEAMVNDCIKANAPVATNSMSLEKARETGAEALFGEKYDNEVRVVSMGPSVELCGGTHVNNTGEIEAFKIISEKSVASGIRRIEAKTASGLQAFLRQQQEKLEQLVTELHSKISAKNLELTELGVKVDTSHMGESDPKALEEMLRQKDKEIERLNKQNLLSGLDGLTSEKLPNIHLLSHVFDGVDAKDLREIANNVKSQKAFNAAHIFALFGCKDGKVATIIAVSDDILEKYDAAKLIRPVVEAIGGKGGGGKKDLAMGGGVNQEAIPEAINILKGLV